MMLPFLPFVNQNILNFKTYLSLIKNVAIAKKFANVLKHTKTHLPYPKP